MSRRPFAETLRDLIASQGLSVREIARRTQRQAGWGSPTAISEMQLGELMPSPAAMELLAKALDTPPETFAEYRLWKARSLFDPGRTPNSFKQAMANLDRFTESDVGADLLEHSGVKAVRRPRRSSGGARSESA